MEGKGIGYDKNGNKYYEGDLKMIYLKEKKHYTMKMEIKNMKAILR